jgi:hypothetical protein
MSIKLLGGELTIEVKFKNSTLQLKYIVIIENFYQNIELDKSILRHENKKYLVEDDYAEQILEKVMNELNIHSKFNLSEKSPIEINKELSIDFEKVFEI